MFQNDRVSTKFVLPVLPDFFGAPFLPCYGIHISIGLNKYLAFRQATPKRINTCVILNVDLKNSPSSRMGHPREKQSGDLKPNAAEVKTATAITER